LVLIRQNSLFKVARAVPGSFEQNPRHGTREIELLK